MTTPTPPGLVPERFFDDAGGIAPKWRRRGDWNWCTEDSKEAEILEEVRPLPGEIVVNKTSSGAFNSGVFNTVAAALP